MGDILFTRLTDLRIRIRDVCSGRPSHSISYVVAYRTPDPICEGLRRAPRPIQLVRLTDKRQRAAVEMSNWVVLLCVDFGPCIDYTAAYSYCTVIPTCFVRKCVV